ncbi:MAG: exonuclease domain-containing protein [Bifidobacteriaceae bacterium]|nr:exonuclease domain-containing protein [Bifidobacteriaceae bacterium]
MNTTSNNFDILNEALNQAPHQTLSTLLRDSWFLGFDTETTGINPKEDGIASACMVLRNPEFNRDGDVIGEWLINPERPMNPIASQVNGFTDEYLQEHGQDAKEGLLQMKEVIELALSKNIPILAYNAPFDIRQLQGDLEYFNLPSLSENLLVIDPLVIDKKFCIRRGKRNLATTAEYYNITPFGDYHNATADTVVAIDVMQSICSNFDMVANTALSDIMTAQRIAFKQSQDSFNQWAKSQGVRERHDTWL